MIKFPKELKKEEIRRIICKKGVRVYFVGIGGISMSSLAHLLKNRGALVMGSDIRQSEVTDALIKNGIKVRLCHSKEAFMSFCPDLSVYSLSIGEENPEYRAAREMNVPVVSRAELLGALMEDYALKIGVSGSHGKSSTTAMLYDALLEGGLDPTVLCGAEIKEGTGLVTGGNSHLVYEACEYGDSFLELTADVQLLLNLELDHTDYFKDEQSIRSSFLRAANSAKKCCILNADSKNLQIIKDSIATELHTFSSENGCEYKYECEHVKGGSYSFKLYKRGKLIGEYLSLARGRFNLENAVATAVTADVIGVKYEDAARAICCFRGIKRRLQQLKCGLDFDVFYDYAHHPSEIASVREALSDMGYERISVIFAPHTYSRTQSFAYRFASELAKFNTVYITEIYGARENAVVGVNASSLAESVRSCGGSAYAVGEAEARRVFERINSERPDCAILMGAGSLEAYKKEFFNR